MATRLCQSSSRRLTAATRFSAAAAAAPSGRRTLFGFGKKAAKATDAPAPLLAQDDLFHPLSQSPFAEMRAKSQRIKQLAYCPVSLDKHGEKVHVAFECPDCGYPTHASEERWAEDTEKGRYWPRLREANEDEHDLRSGREMTEFNLPGVCWCTRLRPVPAPLTLEARRRAAVRGSRLDGQLGCLSLHSWIPFSQY